MKFLLYGKGWIGLQVAELLQKDGDEVAWGKERVDDVEKVEIELREVKPDRVMCMIGRTHSATCATIDCLESKDMLATNVKDNLFAPVSLALLCQKVGIHMASIATGCIFCYDEAHTIGGQGFTPSDVPNFFGSSYSVVKGFTDRLLHQIPCLTFRIRMPISGTSSGRDFITKISKYQKICSIENSMSYLPSLLPVMIDLSRKSHLGVINMTNPGTICHNRVLELYKEIVDPGFMWENFSEEEQAKILAAGRSNNLLDTAFLEEEYPEVPGIEEAVVLALKAMRDEKESADASGCKCTLDTCVCSSDKKCCVDCSCSSTSCCFTETQ